MCEWLTFLMLVFGCDVCDPVCKAYLHLGYATSDSVRIELVNTCPVRGIQFYITPPENFRVETTRRTEGFFAQYSNEYGAVIILSLTGDKINPGMGSIAKLTCDGVCGAYYISRIKIVF